MAALRDIRRRIDSIREIRQITKAMNMIATSKLKKAQSTLSSFSHYAEALDGIIKNLIVRCERETHPLLARRKPSSGLLLLITSDRGLCGGFNANVCEAAIKLIKEGSMRLVIVGKKGVSYLSRTNYEIIRSLPMPDPPERSLSISISQMFITSYIKGEYDEVYILFNEFVTISKQRVKRLRLLPIEAERPPGFITDYLYEPDKRILDDLIPHYLEVSLYQAMLSSAAAEHAARMMAMNNATKNATEMIDGLILFFNKTRQTLITKEMLEIITSLEAIAKLGL